MSVRIVELREITKPIASPIRNAYIDFSKMTTSLVAVVTDVVRDGRRVVGYGFNSNGRYGQGGLIRERFANRILEAEPASLLDDAGTNLDPVRVWSAMMANEKPGGHGERSVAVGTIDMAVWDAMAKIAGQPLFRLLADRHGRKADPKVFVYAAGGYYYPGKDLGALRAEMRSYVERGYNVVKMKIGGAPIDEDRGRIEAVLEEIGNAGAPRRRRQRPVRSRNRDRLRQDAARLSAVLVRGSRRPARLSAPGGAGRVLSRSDGDRRKSVQPSGRAQSYSLRRHAPGSRLSAIRLRFVIWAGRIRAHAQHARRPRLVAAPLHSAWRPSDVAEYRGRPRPGRQ